MGPHHHCHLLALTTVNIRAFNICNPNTKQKKFPTTQQLKKLEAAYKWNVKPSVEHRQKLALEINMTPRDVQVCLRFFLRRLQC